jgi:uncharacterized zinc-type alcohol dehydrogenase-like protein
MTIRAMAARSAGAPLTLYEFDPGPLGPEQVEIAVDYCGICHSDLSTINNEWGIAQFPVVPGHEVVGRVVAAGPGVKRAKVGDTVGLGWYSASCMHCRQCLAGDHNLCPTAEATMLGRPGGFASRVRAHWSWATPLPAGVDPAKAGPLFCGGITVFNPIVQLGVRPTDRVGVVGIGGLGHLALQFLNKWGCEVFAFTSSDSKRDEALRLGAHHAVNSRDAAQLARVKGLLDMVLVTVNVPMNWAAYTDALGPRGRLHFVGAVLEPVPVSAFGLIMHQKSVSGSPLGSPATTADMLDFCARHKVAPVTETFPMSKANEALKHLADGKARYRVVLANDLG